MKILIILFVVLLSEIKTKKDTKALLILARHGIRESSSYLIDPNLSSLITPNGQRMLYLNDGKYIRKNYNDFMSKKLRKFFLSSSESRNLISSNAFYLGLYDLNSYTEELKNDEKYFTPEWKNIKIENNFKTALPQGFRPVPIMSEFGSSLTFKTYFAEVCPKVKQFKLKNIEKESDTIKLANSILDLIKSENLDLNLIIKKDKFEKFIDLIEFYDYVISEYMIKGLKYSDKFLNKIEILGTLGIIGEYYHDRSFMKYHLTRINRIILDLFNNAIVNGSDSMNFIYLNGHDVNILSYFYLLEKTGFECLVQKFKKEDFSTVCFENPKFGSMIIFELFKNNGDFFVDVIYNGMKIDVFNSEDCNFKNFEDIINSISRQGSLEELDRDFCLEDDLKTTHYVTVFFMIVNIVLCCVVVFFIYKKKKKN